MQMGGWTHCMRGNRAKETCMPPRKGRAERNAQAQNMQPACLSIAPRQLQHRSSRLQTQPSLPCGRRCATT